MLFHRLKGIVALDIDGTLTADAHDLDPAVIEFLSKLAQENWKFIFLTGRPFQWGSQTLKSLPFPYALAVQNGALLLEMPSKNILSRKYLTSAILSEIEDICQEQKSDFVIYSGLENDDWCYYRPDRFSSSILEYVLQRTAFLGEKWQPLQSFSQLPVSRFSSIKFFAEEKQAFILSQRIEKGLGLHAPPNRDPFNPEYFVIQATHADATKGQVLGEFKRLMCPKDLVIAAGDDFNDISMLQVADIKIVMANAPSDVLKIADIIAPPATELGIIHGLAEAINRINYL